eukprot:8521055-Pyramimonas_sp.AAC.1
MILKLTNWVQLRRCKAGRFQKVALALVPRTLVSRFARISRIEGGVFSTVALALAPRAVELRFGTIQDCQGATVTWSRGVEVPCLVFWHRSRSSQHNSRDEWRR